MTTGEESTRSLLLVFSEPVEGMLDEYNRWYDTRHLPDVVKIPGVVSGRRYDVDRGDKSPGAEHEHLALYEIDGDPAAAIKEMATRYGTEAMPASDSLDLARTSISVWVPRGEPIS